MNANNFVLSSYYEGRSNNIVMTMNLENLLKDRDLELHENMVLLFRFS